MKKLLPIFLILSILALVYGAKMYQYEDNPALNSEIENIYLEMQRGIRVKIGSFTCPGSTGNYSVTGIPFKPRCVEFNISRNYNDDISQCFGRMDYNGDQHVTSMGSEDDRQRSAVNTDKCLYLIDSFGDALLSATYISMNNDGYTINFTTVNTAFTILWKAVR